MARKIKVYVVTYSFNEDHGRVEGVYRNWKEAQDAADLMNKESLKGCGYSNAKVSYSTVN